MNNPLRNQWKCKKTPPRSASWSRSTPKCQGFFPSPIPHPSASFKEILPVLFALSHLQTDGEWKHNFLGRAHHFELCFPFSSVLVWCQFGWSSEFSCVFTVLSGLVLICHLSLIIHVRVIVSAAAFQRLSPSGSLPLSQLLHTPTIKLFLFLFAAILVLFHSLSSSFSSSLLFLFLPCCIPPLPPPPSPSFTTSLPSPPSLPLVWTLTGV